MPSSGLAQLVGRLGAGALDSSFELTMSVKRMVTV